MNQELTLTRTAQPSLTRHIPPWVLNRLQNALDCRVHYEASLYGPYNTFFTALFPMERRFMVKPQGLLRKEFEGDIASDKGSIASQDLQELIADTNNRTITSWVQGVETASHENADTAGPARRVDHGPHPGDISLDSAGGMVVAAQKKGSYGIPDFVIVKATETLLDDTIIAIVEVKAKDDLDTYNQAFVQVTEYLDFAVSKQRDPNLKGYLLMAQTVHVWGFDSPAPDADWKELTSYPMDLDRLKQELYDIAGTHWGI